MTQTDLLAELERRYQNARTWNIKKGVGTFVTLEIGDEIKPGTGHLHVWVQYAAWSLEHRGREILSSSHHVDDYREALAQLDGKFLQGISAQSTDAPGVSLRFSDEYELWINADLEEYDTDDDMVSFFEGDGRIVSVSAGSGVYEEPPE